MNDDLRLTGHTGRVMRYLLVVASVLAIVAGGAFFLVGGLATARNAEERVRCERVLEAVLASLKEAQHDSQSRVSPDVLQAALRKVAPTASEHSIAHSGPARDVSEAYVVARDFDATRLGTDVPRVPVCDKPGNHVLRLRNGLTQRRNGKTQEQALLLLSTGHVAVWIGDSDEYREWVADFVAGAGSPLPPGMEERILVGRRDALHQMTEPTDAADSR
jgi:hypothetical protein